MNWNKFVTNNLSYEKAFETLCDQLFENWVTETYKNEIKNFRTVNGSGGDGGIESYALLKSNDFVCLQAKWFINAMGKSQIDQIARSIDTAKKVRPKIVKYIVCIPRNLSSAKSNTKNTEEDKWNKLIEDFKKKYPELEINLWDDQRLLNEIQKPKCVGIHKYWFQNTELSKENIRLSFYRAKESWLKTKYVPELNIAGVINHKILKMVGTIENKKNLLLELNDLNYNCQRLMENSRQLIEAIDKKASELTNNLKKVISSIEIVYGKNIELIEYITNEQKYEIKFNNNLYIFDFKETMALLRRETMVLLKKYEKNFDLYIHFNDVVSCIEHLHSCDFDELSKKIQEIISDNPMLFLGEPGTGKTHGLANVTENILNCKYHIPILIDAKSINENETWQDLIVKNLRLSSTWNESELWQALSTLAYKNKIDNLDNEKEISILPKVLIMIDAIDESKYYNTLKKLMLDAKLIIKKYPMLRFAFTSRPYVFYGDNTIDGFDITNLNPNGDTSVYNLYEKYIDFYNIKIINNNNIIKYSLNTPFALKLFCDLNKNETINAADRENISVNNLIKEKINKIEKEFSEKYAVSTKNQYIFKSIKLLSNVFKNANEIEWDQIIKIIIKELNVMETKAENIISFLNNYGIVGIRNIKESNLLEEDKVFVFKGIQGYFDFITAEIILNENKHPNNIDFNRYDEIDKNAIYSLAALSMQKFDYLLTKNITIKSIMDMDQINEIKFFSLRNTNLQNSKQYVEELKEFMLINSNCLFTVIKELILPLSRCQNHPLGISIFNKYLSSFSTPAKRDVIWSYYGYISSEKGDKWYRQIALDLDNPNYFLNSDDEYDGLPIFYVWTLSGLNNKIREKSRNQILSWAIMAPQKFIKLFHEFSNCNDPQIVEELYSVLMCCLFECGDKQLIENIGNWIIENVLSKNNIDNFRNVAIRYYCINILKKAITMGIYKADNIKMLLPPYEFNNININLNDEALRGTRMDGYKCIRYDLSRYVLVDHFNSFFYGNSEEYNIISAFLAKFGKISPQYNNLSFEKFIISATYQYILEMGWNEKDFSIYCKDNQRHYGFDHLILSEKYYATHGIKSDVMTVCEKYVWQARHILDGFLSDRLPVKINNKWEKIEKYETLESFYIPSQDLNLINYHNISMKRNIYCPEIEKFKFEKNCYNIKKISEEILNSQDIECDKWLMINNENMMFNVKAENVLTLYNYLNYVDENGINTIVSINSLIVENSQLQNTINLMKIYTKGNPSFLNPNRWSGNIESPLYVTPKEICWFPWIDTEEPYEIEKFSNIEILAATDNCTYNNTTYGDVRCIIPSPFIRNLLNIINSNGYTYNDENLKDVAEFYSLGPINKTHQEILVVSAEILAKLVEKNKTLIWLFEEYRSETSKAREIFRKTPVEKRICSLVYYENKKFVKEEINRIFNNKIDN